ncbi:methyltransferase [Pseudonocardia asaccharolytica]|uniref:methyltransferase n=1 Tax=Pseudonocardia asaccharolytica TaxID=54010 RepID=UPI00137760AE|nr:methyltransferase [Pseudonocardia asaccharolytica]
MIDGARRRISGSPAAQRIELVGAGFFAEAPEGDLYLLKRILHDWDDERARRILATNTAAGPPRVRALRARGAGRRRRRCAPRGRARPTPCAPARRAPRR